MRRSVEDMTDADKMSTNCHRHRRCRIFSQSRGEKFDFGTGGFTPAIKSSYNLFSLHVLRGIIEGDSLGSLSTFPAYSVFPCAIVSASCLSSQRGRTLICTIFWGI